MTHYSRTPFERRATGVRSAARRVLEAVWSLVQPSSAIDLGCGDASFLAVVRELGCQDITGVEGPWISEDQLQIPLDCFMRADLDQTFVGIRRYELAISIEVVEQLQPQRARSFIEDLTRLADVVLFSAAIPGQGGRHHVNERWQSFWAAEFDRLGYLPVDCLRERLWVDPAVPVPWRQNMIIYACEAGLARWPALAASRASTKETMLDLVHPLAFWRARKPRGIGRVVGEQIPAALAHSVSTLLGRRSGGLNKPS